MDGPQREFASTSRGMGLMLSAAKCLCAVVTALACAVVCDGCLARGDDDARTGAQSPPPELIATPDPVPDQPAEKPDPEALHKAAKDGDAHTVTVLLEQGADVNTKTDKNATPMHWAVEGGSAETAELLLDRGADPNARTVDADGRDDKTPLHLAAEAGMDELVKLLLTHGAALNAPDASGYTPLYLAVGAGHHNTVRLLLDQGADVDAKTGVCDGEGSFTALHVAADIELAKMLLDHGADVNAKATDGMTPLHVAVMDGTADMVDLLLERGANSEAALADECEHEFADEFRTDGYRPLHFAAMKNKTAAARILLSHGAKVDSRNTYGETPLIIAACAGHVEVARVLLEHGANPRARDRAGMSAVDLAGSWEGISGASWDETKDAAMTKLFKQHGASR